MIRFVADDHAGKLARWLRLLGYDTLYFPAIQDRELAALAEREGRIVLTCDTTLAHRFPAMEVFRLEDEDPFCQLAAVVRRFDLDCESHAFTRCMMCNALLEVVEKEACRGEVPPQAFACCRQFARCTGCRKLYWDGTHYLRMKERLAGLGL
jgi:uncharacterized protein with PIN domain